ncbi:hypothetical protein Y032_0430g1311 [Ancylostoma ceylanicum]|uniref:Glucuronosyltransferase n=1 Tax=Ancylostoma ceylanicum TaxID=53326 RepID=A0A016X1J3_9BILA|nr:hypothetical protein Y032_0430g1311 [Ancylostoma ceylanicum]
MGIKLLVSLLTICTCAASLKEWKDMNIEEILQTVLKGLPITKNFMEQLKLINWEPILKSTLKAQYKWPEGLIWPEGLEKLKNEFVPRSKTEQAKDTDL